jgi:DNA-binding Lrp family transcriptional regulator
MNLLILCVMAVIYCAETGIGASDMMAAMDKIDHAIVEVLLSDGRATYARIGSSVGLSVAATKRRIDRLIRDNVIRGFTAVVDPQVSGSADAVLRVVAADVVQLERVISRLRGLTYVQQTDTTMLLSRLLSRPAASPFNRSGGG